MATRLRPPALLSEAPSLMASPSPIKRATSAQASLRTRSASRRDSSPSSARGKLRNSMSHRLGWTLGAPRNCDPLVLCPAALARPRQRRDMSQRLLEQRRVLETVTNALLELPGRTPPASRLLRPGGACPVALSWWRLRDLDALALWRTAHRRTAHRMIEKNRLRRSAVGQRQTCQAAAPSPMEK